MNYNPNPRTELLKDTEAIKKHHLFAEDNQLRAHLLIAMGEMQRRAAMNTDASNFNQESDTGAKLDWQLREAMPIEHPETAKGWRACMAFYRDILAKPRGDDNQPTD